MLRVKDLTAHYGVIRALKGVSLEVNQGEIVTLIGGNGAGKTTTLKSIVGLLRPTSGEVSFLGQSLVGLPAQRVVTRGISLVPEGREIFPNLTVLENLEMGAYTRNDTKGVREDIDYISELFPILAERRGQLGGTLSGGEQQMLAIGRGLMSRPKLLCLDEPSMGLAPMVVERIFSTIKTVNQEGTTVLLVEQKAPGALAIADRAYVIETGEIAMSGPAAELARNPEIKRRYLGG
jgi:branched-chain amino acid transport system ATP-binding protein